MALPQPDISVLESTSQAAALLSPVRLRLVESLREPDSAAGLARRLDLPRQRVNYHLRELEKEGIVELVEERRRGNCIERIVRAKASHYLIDPALLGSLGADPDAVRDHFSSSYLIALAARMLRELSTLRRRAAVSKKRLATFALHTDVRFASSADRKAFSEELATAISTLVAKYHDDDAKGGRTFRYVVGAHPAVEAQPADTAPDPDSRGDME